LSTQLRTNVHGPPSSPPLAKRPFMISKFSTVVTFMLYDSNSTSGLIFCIVCLAASTFDRPAWCGWKKSRFMLAISTLS
jgi:hypothetical protein